MNTIEKRKMLIDDIVGLANGNVFSDEDKPWNITKTEDEMVDYKSAIIDFLKIKNPRELAEMREFFKGDWKQHVKGKKCGKSTISDYTILYEELNRM